MEGNVITRLGSAIEDACLASVQDMHSCDNSVVQHCADLIKHNTHCAAGVVALSSSMVQTQ